MITKLPYHQPGTADGLAFSCGYTKSPQPSLRFIAEEIKNTTGSERISFNNFDLSYLATQGVLLINSSLTVQQGKPNSYRDLWLEFMDYLFKEVINKKPHSLVYCLLGAYSQNTFSEYLRKEDIAITASHPASAAYKGQKWSSEDLFNEINEQLKLRKLTPIGW